MYIDNNDNIFSELDPIEKKHVFNFFQEFFLPKGQEFLKVSDEVKNVYFLQKGQVLVTDKNGYGLGFLNPTSIIGVSIIYDYSKKTKLSDVNLTTFQDCSFLIIPEEIIKKITDKDRVVFSKIINQIRAERHIFSQGVIL